MRGGSSCLARASAWLPSCSKVGHSVLVLNPHTKSFIISFRLAPNQPCNSVQNSSPESDFSVFHGVVFFPVINKNFNSS